MRRPRHQLAEIERHLAVDDPHLAEVFRLWNEQCTGGDDPDRPTPGPHLVLLLGGVALVLTLWALW